jgi:hypothetical protein
MVLAVVVEEMAAVVDVVEETVVVVAAVETAAVVVVEEYLITTNALMIMSLAENTTMATVKAARSRRRLKLIKRKPTKLKSIRLPKIKRRILLQRMPCTMPSRQRSGLAPAATDYLSDPSRLQCSTLVRKSTCQDLKMSLAMY